MQNHRMSAIKLRTRRLILFRSLRYRAGLTDNDEMQGASLRSGGAM